MQHAAIPALCFNCVETSWLMRLLPDAAPSCCMLELCCCCRSPSRSMASYTCLRGRVLTRASSLTIGSAARPSSDGQALLTRHSSSSRTCSCSLAELQASAPLHLRGASEVANTRVAFCRSFRITIQIGTCACHAVVCAALDRTAWHMSLADDNLLSNDDGVEQ